eukprot:COSAG05_NODE_18499_length_307_cov_1.134615_1_plen_57_part_01
MVTLPALRHRRLLPGVGPCWVAGGRASSRAVAAHCQHSQQPPRRHASTAFERQYEAM